MKSIYNIVLNDHGNHITISYGIHKSENHHQTNTQGNNLVISGPQWTGNDVLSRYRHALELHGQTGKYHLISHHICACIIQSPNYKSAQAHGPKPLCVLRRAPKACISISVCISYLYLCNHHTACICPQKAKAPKHMAQSLYVCSDGPQRPLISYHLHHCIWKGRILSNDFKNNHYTHIHIPFNHTLNHTTFEYIFLIFKKLSCFIQSRYTKSLTKHFNIISMRE